MKSLTQLTILASAIIAVTAQATPVEEIAQAHLKLLGSCSESSMEHMASTIRHAKNAAALYIASDEQICGTALEEALDLIRETNSSLAASDMEIAQLILKTRV